jgi:hypothetical protein
MRRRETSKRSARYRPRISPLGTGAPGVGGVVDEVTVDPGHDRGRGLCIVQRLQYSVGRLRGLDLGVRRSARGRPRQQIIDPRQLLAQARARSSSSDEEVWETGSPASVRSRGRIGVPSAVERGSRSTASVRGERGFDALDRVLVVDDRG